MNKSVAVLGGDGFIGRNLIKCLAENSDYNVVSFSNAFEPNIQHYDNVEYLVGDFFNEDDIKEVVKNNDILVHAICTINPGNSNERRLFAYTHDLIYTIKFCELCVKYGRRIVFISSGGTVYGNQTEFPIKEDAKTHPINHYGNLKLCTENTLRTYAVQQGANIIIARIANVYGPGQSYEKGVGFVDAVIKCAMENKEVEVFGNGKLMRDYIYINDACRMLAALIKYDGSERIFNISTAEGTTQNEIVNIVKERFPGLKVNYHEKRSVDLEKVVLSNTKIRNIYYDDITDIRKGIELFIDYRLREKVRV